MARLGKEEKTEFRNMQRAWVKFASEAKNFFKYFNISEDEENAYYLDILTHQADFLAAVSAGTIPNKEIKDDIKALESKLKEALNDVEAVISDRMNKFNKVQNEWQKYIALKRKVVNMLGLDGDEAYKQEYVFWTDWLKYFATDMI